MDTRRRAPGWVREMTSLSLHRLGGRLINDARIRDLSSRQEAVWAAVVSELEYRNRRRIIKDRCTCLICVGPFVEEDPNPAERLEGLYRAEDARSASS